MTRLDTLARYFQQIRMSPAHWPIRIIASVAEKAAVAKWPNFPEPATLSHHRLGHGAGEDASIAITRAVGELIEIASCCAWGDESFVTAPRTDLRTPNFGPADLTGFSPEQLQSRDAWNASMAGLDWIAEPACAEGPIDWMQATCLFSDRILLVPADCVLIGRHSIGDADACAIADTNGCAAGETTEDACLRALFELIERDATGRWWYGQRPAPVLDHPDHPIDASLIDHLERQGRHVRLLDLTSDLNVPTVAALAMDASGRHLGAGFATRANRQAAIRAALTELMQMELRIIVARANVEADPQLARWFAEVSLDKLVAFRERPPPARPPQIVADIDLQTCKSHLAAAGIRVAIMDFTRREFAVPVVRAISPDLCHWKPRFGRRRLLETDESGENPAADGSANGIRPRNPYFLRI